MHLSALALCYMINLDMTPKSRVIHYWHQVQLIPLRFLWRNRSTNFWMNEPKERIESISWIRFWHAFNIKHKHLNLLRNTLDHNLVRVQPAEEQCRNFSSINLSLINPKVSPLQKPSWADDSFSKTLADHESSAMRSFELKDVCWMLKL